MLDDATLDHLLIEADPLADDPIDTDAAWARLLARSGSKKRRRPTLLLIPGGVVCAATLTVGLVNWIPSGTPGAVSPAYARSAIAAAAKQLAGTPGHVLYMEVLDTLTSSGHSSSSSFKQWQQIGSPRDSRTDETRADGASIVGGQIAIVNHRVQWLDPANHTIYLEGSERPNQLPLNPAAEAADQALGRGSGTEANFESLAQLLDSRRARVRREGAALIISLDAKKLTDHSADWRFYVQAGSYRPLRIVTRYKDVTSTQRFLVYKSLSNAQGLRQINLREVYPHLKVVVEHASRRARRPPSP